MSGFGIVVSPSNTIGNTVGFCDRQGTGGGVAFFVLLPPSVP